MKKAMPMKWMIPTLFIAMISTGLWMITFLSQPENPTKPYSMQFQTDALLSQRSSSDSNTPFSGAEHSKFHASQDSSAQTTAPTDAKTIDADVAINTGRQILANFKQMQAGLAKNPVQPIRGLPRDRGRTSVNPEQQKAIDQLLATLGENADLQMDNVSRTLRHLRGDLKKVVENSESYRQAFSRKDFGEMSLALAREIKSVLNIREPVEGFFAEKVTRDELGMTHVVLQQQYHGAPVWGAEIGVHYNKNNEPIQLSGVYAPTPINMDGSQPEIDRQTALFHAKESLRMTNDGITPPTVERMVYWRPDQAPVMCYGVELTPNYLQSWLVFVAVADGRVVYTYNQVVSAAAVGRSADLRGTIQEIQCWEAGGEYYAIDTTKPMYNAAASHPPKIDQLQGAIFVLDLKDQAFAGEMQVYDVKTGNINQWDPAVVSVMRNFSLTENYFRATFNRNSLNNEGINIWGILHPRFPMDDGTYSTDNAFWNPGFKGMVFGDGDGSYGGILPYSLDIVAHEFTHGITNFTSNLIYEFQSGALNEHFSDFFACMVDREDWLLAEDVVSAPGKIAMRDMENPGNPQVTSTLPSRMSEYVNLPIQQDQGGVHINCGIPNRASFLLAEGPNGISRDNAEKIVYRAQTVYLTQRAQFIDYRRAVISAATDLFGENSNEVQTAKNAFDSVGIVDGEGTVDPTPGAPTEGIEAIVFLAADPSAGVDPVRENYYYQLMLHANGQNFLLAPRYVAHTRPAMSGDGQWGMYVDALNNIYATDGAEEKQWTSNGIVRTIAMSKNLRYIAFATINKDSYIYLINTQTEEVRQIALRIPQPDAPTDAVLNYADVIAFNFRGDQLVFDAESSVKLASGENYVGWGIYSLRLADLSMNIVMQQSPGLQIGNPTFAHTSDHFLLADMVVTQNNQSRDHVVALDFNNQKIGVIHSQLTMLARPSYRGNDRKLVFTTVDQNGQTFMLLESGIGSDNLSLQPNSTTTILSHYTPLSYPVGFRIGTYVQQEGRITAPANVAFGVVQAGASVEKDVTISNQGNGDLQILDIALEGQNAVWFRHNGINQTITAGKQITFQVRCSPPQAGSVNAAIRVKSTDMNQPDVTINLSGTATAAAEPTATAPAQPTGTTVPGTPVASPTNTPSPTPQATQPPAVIQTPTIPSAIQSLITYEFDQASLAANGWSAIPGGFTGAAAGTISPIAFFGSPIPSSKDNKGLGITVQPGQVAFAYALMPINTGGKPILLRLTARSDNANAAIAIAALKGSMTATDTSIATHIPATAASFVDEERTLVLLYEPDSGELITPIIQVAATGAERTVNVLVDRLEAYVIESTIAYPGRYFYGGSVQ